MPISNDQEVRVVEQRERSSCSLPPPYTVIDLVPPPQYAQFERDHEKERCFVAKQEGNQASFLHTSTEQTCESVPMRNAVFNDPEYFV
ncbi:unnamed protein product [Anisakis simplex]|uniref:Uncharacterized protein n=1 Tax=Anisakis simplex TaxID=6269 RepID=A0A0M3IYS2_ANISI|nr:unnamed protein product [Anisakis simplex]